MITCRDEIVTTKSNLAVSEAAGRGRQTIKILSMGLSETSITKSNARCLFAARALSIPAPNT